MSARTAGDDGADIEAHGQICCAPSCWEPGSPITIVGDDVTDEPVLCESHRRAYLGVST